MKKHTKFVTLLLALAMLMVTALPLTAFAAGENGSITITPPVNHTLADTDFNAYKLFDVTVGGTAPNYSFAYTPVQPAVDNFLAKPGMSKYGANADAFLKWLQAARTEDEIIGLAKDLTANKGLFTAISATAAAPNVKINNLDYGYYLVTGAATRDGQKVISRSMLVTVPTLVYTNNAVTGTTKDAQVKLKAEAPEIDKEVWNDDCDPAAGIKNSWDDWTDANIGKTVEFKLTSKVPDMAGYDRYTFAVHDTMSKGLTFGGANKVTIKLVKAGENDIIVDPYQYTVTTSPATDTSGAYAGGTKIDIAFPNFKEDFEDFTGWTIEILYEATLNENAVVGAPGNPNKVNLEYSNNPYDEDDKGKTPDKEVKVYTFELKIFKYTGVDTPLAGAEFELSPKTGANTYGAAIKFVKLTGDPNYDYRVAMPGEAGDTVLVSNANGLVRIEGLDAGEYGLKETKAPDGYNLIPGWITTIIVHKAPFQGESSLTVGSLTGQEQVSVLNNAGGTLPGTGGIGTYIFFGLGGAMALLLCVALVAYRKKKALEALDAE
ncbi:MAG: SpaH/EbpB family LPXTG-anchored major pilin [Oscillospiraceae bacterium]|nr:SpaH/EbpB family LPXTG-anchored major pilin [Oscillospiraceae bacterium]